MKYEVELKFRLDDLPAVESKLREIGAKEEATVSHVDRYFNHPARDFRQTDEAFRIRSVGETNCVTYKGAKIGSVAKTRHEIEVGIAEGADAAKQFADIVSLLSFRFVREVKKTRRSLSLDWQNRSYELALDFVSTLGNFLEIELIAEAAERENAEAAVWELAKALGLAVAEPRSYLDMLIESDGSLG